MSSSFYLTHVHVHYNFITFLYRRIQCLTFDQSLWGYMTLCSLYNCIETIPGCFTLNVYIISDIGILFSVICTDMCMYTTVLKCLFLNNS